MIRLISLASPMDCVFTALMIMAPKQLQKSTSIGRSSGLSAMRHGRKLANGQKQMEDKTLTGEIK